MIPEAFGMRGAVDINRLGRQRGAMMLFVLTVVRLLPVNVIRLVE